MTISLGFKKRSDCSHAVYLLRYVTDYYVSSGFYALDLSKAFDKMNHYGLFIKLMERQIPENLLLLLERWFSICMSCVKYSNGVMHGPVGLLCAVEYDKEVCCLPACLQLRHTCGSILLYADDKLLLAPSVSALQLLLSVCEKELKWFDMSVNAKKISMFAYWPTIQC